MLKACRGRNLFFNNTDDHKHGEADIIFLSGATNATCCPGELLCSNSANTVGSHCCGQGMHLAQAACCCSTVYWGQLEVWACSPVCSANRKHAAGVLLNAVVT